MFLLVCKGLSIDDVGGGGGVEGHRISGDTTGRALVLTPSGDFVEEKFRGLP